jgi:hypothetical protein
VSSKSLSFFFAPRQSITYGGQARAIGTHGGAQLILREKKSMTCFLPEKQEKSSDMMALVKGLLAAADRYGMERLKICCKADIAQRLEVGNAGDVLALADRYHCLHLKQVCLDFYLFFDQGVVRVCLDRGIFAIEKQLS